MGVRDNKIGELITIAITLYNTEKYIERGLLSALNQTYPNIEFLLIDDRGQDDPLRVVEPIMANHERGSNIRIVQHDQNRGTGAVRNTAIQEAKGELLYFMDGDDALLPDCIEKLYAIISETPVDFVGASYDLLENSGEFLKVNTCKYIHIKDNPGLCIAEAYYTNKINIFVQTWNKLFKLSFLRENNIECVPNHINEDELFTFQLLIKARSCVLLPDVTYHHYIVPGSTVNDASLDQTKIKRRIEQYKEIVEKKKSYWLEYYENTNLSKLVFLSIMNQAWGYMFFILKYSKKLDQDYIKKSIHDLLDISFLETLGKDPVYDKWRRRSKFPIFLLSLYYYRYNIFIAR